MKDNYLDRCVSAIAMKDISDDIKKSKKIVTDDNHDVWVVTPAILNSKEQRKLNKELGISSLNKQNKK